MSALGYPDWQRLTNWDGPVLWGVTTGAITTTQTSPLMDVSRYGAIGGFLALTQGQASVQINWYADKAQQILLGARFLTLDAQISNRPAYRINNLGPYCQIVVTLLGAGPWTFGAQIMPTNRFGPVEIFPEDATLLAFTTPSLAVNGTSTRTLGLVWSGPAHLYVSPTTLNNSNVSLFYLDVAGGYLFYESYDSTAPNTVYNVLVPPKSLRITVTNTGTLATTYYIALTASMTGAA